MEEEGITALIPRDYQYPCLIVDGIEQLINAADLESRTLIIIRGTLLHHNLAKRTQFIRDNGS